MRMLSLKMKKLRGLKNDILDQKSWGFSSLQLSEAIARRCFTQKVSLTISKKFTGKKLCWSHFLIKTASLTLCKIDSANALFCTFCNILKRTFSNNTYAQLILSIIKTTK